MATAARKQTPAPPAEEPTRHAWEDPRYIAARDRLMGIRQQLLQVEEEILAELDQQQQFRTSSLRLARAEAIVDGAPEPRDAVFNRDLGQLRERQATLRIAEGLADQRLNEVCALVSIEIVRRETPAYRDLITRQRAAALALREVLAEGEAFLDDMVNGGTILGAMQPIAVLQADDLRQRIESEFNDRAHVFYGLEFDPDSPAAAYRRATARPARPVRPEPPADAADWSAA